MAEAGARPTRKETPSERGKAPRRETGAHPANRECPALHYARSEAERQQRIAGATGKGAPQQRLGLARDHDHHRCGDKRHGGGPHARIEHAGREQVVGTSAANAAGGMNPSARARPSGSWRPFSTNSGRQRHSSMVTRHVAKTTKKSCILIAHHPLSQRPSRSSPRARRPQPCADGALARRAWRRPRPRWRRPGWRGRPGPRPCT